MGETRKVIVKHIQLEHTRRKLW